MLVDLSGLPPEDCREMAAIFRQDHELRLNKAIARQQATAAFRRDKVRWHADALPRYEIDPHIDAHWRQHYGNDYLNNPDVMRFLARRNPEIVIRARAPKTQVGYTKASAECGVRSAESPRKQAPVRFGPGTLELAK